MVEEDLVHTHVQILLDLLSALVTLGIAWPVMGVDVMVGYSGTTITNTPTVAETIKLFSLNSIFVYSYNKGCQFRCITL